MKILARLPVPVFPLPNVVLYPRVVLPLHIFEARYRKMLSCVLDSHGLIAMALLKPGWEPAYHGYPEVYSVVTVGQIATYRTNEDGTTDVVLVGVCRAQIVEWAEQREYREARLVELGERRPSSTSGGDRLRRRLRQRLSQIVPTREGNPGVRKLQQFFSNERDVGFLVDFLAYHFLRKSDAKQRILEELDVERRAGLLFQVLARRGGAKDGESSDR